MAEMEEYPWRDAERLRTLYLEKELSQNQIAEKLGTSGSVIHRWLNRHDIETRKRGDTRSTSDTPWRDEDTMRQLYVEEGLSTYQIGEELGCSYQTAHDWLERHDVETRESPTQKAEKKRPPKEELREKYESGLSTEELGEEYGVPQQTAWGWLEQYDIDRRLPGHLLSGEDSYAWVEENIQTEYGPLWREQREKAIERDGECVRCGMSREEHKEAIGRDITVHHLRKARKFEDLEDAHDLDNLITLCLPCHQAVERFPIDVRHIQNGGD